MAYRLASCSVALCRVMADYSGDPCLSPIRYIATWKFGRLACDAGLPILVAGGSCLDAVEIGANAVEEDPSVLSVGYGGLPNSEGVIELDAAIMDGTSHSAGAVAGITGVRKPISVARRVMEKTPHVMLAGNNARRFAIQQGFPECDLHTEESLRRFYYWRNNRSAPSVSHFEDLGHDTVGICALDISGNLAAGCTTSGLAWKTPGRVGDSPIIGSGLYVDNRVGAATATGNGDEMMKVCLSFKVVAAMEAGRTPQEACEEAIRYLLRLRPGSQSHGAACIALNKEGEYGAAATRDGFHAPERLWEWWVADQDETITIEGPYISP